MAVDYGTGADGALHFDGVTAVLGISPSGSHVYQLTGNINASSITIDAGVTIFAANWQIYCTGALTGAGSTSSRIHCNGYDAPTPTGPSPVNATYVPQGFYSQGTPGNNGSLGITHSGLPFPFTQPGYAAQGVGGIFPVAATDGGDGPDAMKGGGGGGCSGPDNGSYGMQGGDIFPASDPDGTTTYDESEQKSGHVNGSTITVYQWASGGGHGATTAHGTGGGTIEPMPGGGAGGGACLYVAAKTLSGVWLSADGGAGHDGVAGDKYATGGGSGGGGGGGGVVILHYYSKTDTQISAFGGAGGLGSARVGSVARDGGTGHDGLLFLYHEPEVTSLTITPKPIVGFVGDLIPLTVTANYDNGTTVNVTSLSTYDSTDTAYATVDSAGVVHILAQGSGALVVHALYGGFSVQSPVIVSDAFTNVFWWGPLDPDASHGYQAYWGPMFPDYLQPTVLPPSGPTGVANFQLDLESGSKITLSWLTDVVKAYDGKEYRANLIDEPKVKFDGTAILIGDDTRAMRSSLARSAASGQPFTLGLPYEEMTVTGSGATPQQIPVRSTADSDWALAVGQSVIVFSPDEHESALLAVIQPGGGSNFIQVDADVSSVTRRGARVMPAVSVLLNPNQGFGRYTGTDAVETWQIQAQAYDYGFRSLALKAQASLSASTGYTQFLETLTWTVPGSFANGYTLTFLNDNTTPMTIASTGVNAWTIHYKPNTLEGTVARAIQLLRSVGFDITATFVNQYWNMAAGDAGVYTLSGGADSAAGLWGAGGVIEYLNGTPIWDRLIQVETTATDSIQSMTEIIDWDGVPISIGQARYPDWGRAIRISRNIEHDWAWLKAFLFTIAGRFTSFYLPTWRPDLKYHSPGIPATYLIKIKNVTPADGDFFAWYPKNKYIQILDVDGSINRFQIDDAIDNHDGTISIVSSTFAYSGTPTMISWVELCRFETDDFEITFEGVTFTMDTQARVVQQ